MYLHNRRLYQALRLLADPAAIAAAWSLTVAARIGLNAFSIQQVRVSEAASWAPSLVLLMLLWSALAWRLGHYRAPARRSWPLGLLQTLEQSLAASLLVASLTLFDRSLGHEVSRSFMVLFLPASFLTLALARALTLLFCLRSERLAPPPVRAALVGDAAAAAAFLEQVALRPGRSVFRGVIVPEREGGAPADGVAVLGATPQLAELINRESLTQIVVLNSTLPRGELERCGAICKRMGMPMHYAFELGIGPSRVELSSFHGVPILEVTPVTFSRTQEIVKRCFDLLLGSLAVLFAAPIMLAITIAIRWDTPGPILYRAPRVGKGGRHFTCFKFRSMHTLASRSELDKLNERTGHIFKMRHDPRVTRVGRVLRRYSLDELPQFFNVLRGEMSVVGPRPLPASDLDADGMSRAFAEWAEGRARVQPGITGLWQVRGRSELPFEEMVRLDLEYTRKWSLLLDISILLETPGLVLKGTGAY